MSKENYLVKIMDRIMEDTRGVRIIFILLAAVVVYSEYIYPKLTWITWIVTPIFILSMVGGLWSLMGDAFRDKKELTND